MSNSKFTKDDLDLIITGVQGLTGITLDMVELIRTLKGLGADVPGWNDLERESRDLDDRMENEGRT